MKIFSPQQHSSCRGAIKHSSEKIAGLKWGYYDNISPPQLRKTLLALHMVFSKACLQPTSSSGRMAFPCFYILNSLLKNQKATPYMKTR